jgi:hypothetical protein
MELWILLGARDSSVGIETSYDPLFEIVLQTARSRKPRLLP